MFRYKAATAAGEVLEGEMEAGTDAAVIEFLQAQGHIPIRAEEVAGKPTRSRRSMLGPRRVTSKDVAVLTLELATLLEAGVNLDRALSILGQLAEHDGVREIVGRLRDRVRRGAYLSDAIEEEGRTFPRYYVNLVRAGEAGGVLETTLTRLAELMERSREVREAVLSALIYPMILIAIALASVVVILTFVVPRFAELFDDAGAALPWPTQAILVVGEFLQHYGWAIAAGAVGIWLLGRRQLRDPSARLWFDQRLLRLPLLGDLVVKHEAGRFSRTLGTLLSSGVPLLEAMAVAKEVVANRAIAAGLAKAAERVRDGQGLARPLMSMDVFPRLTGHLLQVGEESGRLDGMLLKLADIYEREVRAALQRIVVVLEPVLILGLGLLVGGIIFSILIAVLQVNELAFL